MRKLFPQIVVFLSIFIFLTVRNSLLNVYSPNIMNSVNIQKKKIKTRRSDQLTYSGFTASL